MTTKELFGIEIENLSKSQVLEKIKKNIEETSSFLHIVSLNPENLIIAQKDKTFKEIVREAQLKIIDGVGVIIAAYLINHTEYVRVTGVELMEDLLDMFGEKSLRVMLIGSKPNLALKIANCYNNKYPTAKFEGLEGIKDIKKPTEEEEKKIFTIVSAFKPQLIFAAFGSPYQEIWFWRHRSQLQGIVCMGVGGGFDYLASSIPRAPRFIQKIGMEWLFRLCVQPWRLGRQLRLIKFVYLVLKEKLNNQ